MKGKTWTTIIVSVLMALAPLAPLPAQAHTKAEFDQWMVEWEARIPMAGLSLGNPLVDELAEFIERHSYLLNPPEPKPYVFRGIGTNVERWRGLVEVYFGDRTETALCIMEYESGGNPNAKNPYSSASGLFQHLGKYWDERSAKAGWGGADIFDPEANIAVAAWLQTVGGWNDWTTWRLCR